MNDPRNSSQTTKLILSFAAIYVIWGTTYLAMRVAVETIPPFLMAGSRFLIAGSVLFCCLYFRGGKFPSLHQWKSALIVGCFLFVGGNGLVTWSEQEIPSGIAALVIATLPMWMTIFDWLFFGGPKPGIRIWIGLLLGFLGVIMLIGPGKILSGETGLHFTSMVALVCAPIFWSLGSLYSRKADLPENVFMANASEMLCGGAALMAISLLFGETDGFTITQVSRASAMSMLYLLIFGSIIALTAYSWLLKNAPAARVATYSYVNPLIAVFLGWILLNEEVSSQIFAAVFLIVAGVVLIVTAPKTPKAQSTRDANALIGESNIELNKCQSP